MSDETDVAPEPWVGVDEQYQNYSEEANKPFAPEVDPILEAVNEAPGYTRTVNPDGTPAGLSAEARGEDEESEAFEADDEIFDDEDPGEPSTPEPNLSPPPPPVPGDEDE